MTSGAQQKTSVQQWTHRGAWAPTGWLAAPAGSRGGGVARCGLATTALVLVLVLAVMMMMLFGVRVREIGGGGGGSG